MLYPDHEIFNNPADVLNAGTRILYKRDTFSKHFTGGRREGMCGTVTAVLPRNRFEILYDDGKTQDYCFEAVARTSPCRSTEVEGYIYALKEDVLEPTIEQGAEYIVSYKGELRRIEHRTYSYVQEKAIELARKHDCAVTIYAPKTLIELQQPPVKITSL